MLSVLMQFAAVFGLCLIFALPLFLLSRVQSQVTFRWAVVYKLVLSTLFFYVGVVGHLINPDRVVELIPGWIPAAYFWCYLTGLLELAFVVGLWIKRTESITGKAIFFYLPLVLPFNIYGWTVAGNTPDFNTAPYYLYGRIPLQFVFMAFAYYGTSRWWHRQT